MKLYLDMDGVLMDFNGHKSRYLPPWEKREYHHLPRSEWTAEEAARDAELHTVMKRREFWTTMQPMPDAHVLWSYCRPLRPKVLTATPTGAVYAACCANDKLKSIFTHFDSTFPVEDFHAVLRSEKRNHAMPGHILVDDMHANCVEWTEAGGLAILHTDAISTIRKLKELLHV
jgi:hypothetical protein